MSPERYFSLFASIQSRAPDQNSGHELLKTQLFAKDMRDLLLELSKPSLLIINREEIKESIKNSDHLRHLRHLDTYCKSCSNDRTNNHANSNKLKIQ